MQPEGGASCALPSARGQRRLRLGAVEQPPRTVRGAVQRRHSSEGPANGVLGQQEQAAWGAAAREEEGDDACHADMLSSFDLNTTQAQRDAARLRSSSGGPAGAFLTAIPAGHMTLGNDMFVASVWRRLWHHVRADVAPPPCKCSTGVTAQADHAMVCENVAKMTQMRHDNLAKVVFSGPKEPPRTNPSRPRSRSASTLTTLTQVVRW